MHSNEEINDHRLSVKQLREKYEIKKFKKKLCIVVEPIERSSEQNSIFPEIDKPLLHSFIKTIFSSINVTTVSCALLMAFLFLIDRSEKEHLVVLLFTVIVVTIKTGFEVRSEYKINRFFKVKIDTYYSRIILDNNLYHIKKEYLKIGDLLDLKRGDVVGADCVLISSNNLYVDPDFCSDLTNGARTKGVGASNENFENAKNVLLSGEKIISGRGKAIVVRVGKDSTLGIKFYSMNAKKPRGSILHTEVDNFSRFTIVISILIATIFTIAGFISKKEISDIYSTAIATFVAFIPEGLHSIMKLHLAISVEKLHARKVYIRDHSALGKLGFLSLILTDTKTLRNLNNRIISHIYDGIFMIDVHLALEEKNDDDLKAIERIGYYFSLIASSKKNKIAEISIFSEIFHKNFVGYYMIPKNIQMYDLREISLTVVTFEKFRLGLITGKTEEVIKKCRFHRLNNKLVKLTSKVKEKIINFSNKMHYLGREDICLASKTYGLSSKGSKIKMMILEYVCYTEEEPDVYTLRTADILKVAGIKFSIISEENELTNSNYREHVLGLPSSNNEDGVHVKPQMISSREFFFKSRINQFYFLNNTNFVIHSCSTDDKAKIFELIAGLHKSFSYLSDSVEDCKFLIHSDMGISFSSSSQLSKESSSLILVTNRFEDIIYGIEEGRLFFENLLKSSKFVMAHITPQIIALAFHVFLGCPIAVSPMLLILLNYLVEIIPSRFFAYEPAESRLITDNPLENAFPIEQSSMIFERSSNEIYNFFRKYFLSSLFTIVRKMKRSPLFPTKDVMWSLSEVGIISGLTSMLSFFWVFHRYGIPINKMFFTGNEYFHHHAKDLELEDSYVLGEEEQDEILSRAQSTFFASVVISQFTNMLVCRRKKSYFYTNFFNNPRLLISSTIGTIISLMILYLKFFHKILFTKTPMAISLILSIPGSFIILGLDTFKKYRKMRISS